MKRPNVINIQLYSSCNCKCKWCTFTDDYKRSIDIEYVLDFLNNHDEIDKLIITGGEPTLAIDKYAELLISLDRSKYTITLQTNGWWGNDANIKNVLSKYRPDYIHLSIDSEKQKYIDIETAKNAYNFIISLNIPLLVVNHTDNQEEFNYYKSIISDTKYGIICYDDKSYDCGQCLCANNTYKEILDMKGWNK